MNPELESSLSKSSESSTLSEYLHSQFETIVAHNSIRHPKEKIEVARRMREFLHPTTSLPCTIDDDMFSPIVSDVHISFEKNITQSVVDSTKQTPGQINIMKSGIQLPGIDWHQHFRKGYCLLMWVRFHPENVERNRESTDEQNSSTSTSMNSVDPWAEDNTKVEPQILYRFATNASPNALGIQATLFRDESMERKNDDCHELNCMLRIESLRSPLPSKVDSTYNVYCNSFTTPVSIPCRKWVLLGVQHAFHYLKPPVVTVTINGVEAGRGELAYPTLGGELGSFMRDNFILCNIPSTPPSATNRVNIDKMDFAGFGIYNESIPVLLQGIIAEHGPSNNADGVIPVVPPVVQNSNAVVTNMEQSSMHNNGGPGHGPFGLSSNRSKDASSSSRNIGIPLCIGVMLSSDGDYQGELLLHRLLSKLVLGLNASRAVKVGDGRVLIPASLGSMTGLTADSPRVGIAQPRDTNRELSVKDSPQRSRRRVASAYQPVESSDENLNMAKCGGNISIFNVTSEFLTIQQRFKTAVGSSCIPSYDLPSTLLPCSRPIPSFINSYLSVDSIGYILQAFHLSLPPAGYVHKLQMRLYHDSFDHLYDLLIYQRGAFAAQLIETFAATISLGGSVKDEILQNGSLHVLANLLRRTLLRASRLGMFKMKVVQENDSLWQIYAPKEQPGDELLDVHALKQSAPSHIPELIVKACCSLIEACCGHPQDESRRWKRPSLPVYIRRASDIALTCIFGFALDMDLWGNDIVACATIMEEIVHRYCSVGFEDSNCTEFTEKFDAGHGRLLRREISVQYLLDVIRTRFGEDIILSRNEDMKIQHAKVSISRSLSRLLYTILKYSLSSSKTIMQGEQDVIYAVNALSDCQLGSIISYSVLKALHDLLVYCEVFPLSRRNLNCKQEKYTDAVSVILYSHVSRYTQQSKKDFYGRLKRVKSDIIARLVRYLIAGQFHDVVAPLLLSRTVFTGSNSSKIDEDGDQGDLKFSEYHHLYLWRLLLGLFAWLVSSSGVEGNKAAKVAGSLFFESAKAGSLSRCLVTNDRVQILSIFIPPLPTPTSAISRDHDPDLTLSENYSFDLFARIKATVHLVGGLTAALILQINQKNEPMQLSRPILFSLSTLIKSWKTVGMFLFNRRTINLAPVSRHHYHIANSTRAVDKHEVKFAIDSVPSLITALVILEETLERLRNVRGCFDFDTWDFVEGGDFDISIDEQMHVVYSCQEELCSFVSLIISRAMIEGGGEASTSVWRTVISSIDSFQTYIVKPPFELQSEKVKHSILLSRRNLLCRLAASVLGIIMYMQDNSPHPWTSLELCSSVARLTDLVEEKKLLCVEDYWNIEESKEKSVQQKLSLDQVRLIHSLLRVLESGRDNTGWCQLLLPNPPVQDFVTGNIEKHNDDQNKANNLNQYGIELVQEFVAHEPLLSTEFIDLHQRAMKDEIYDVSSSIKVKWNEIMKPSGSNHASPISSSKLLLPILQPSLRIILGCLEYVRGVSVIIHCDCERLGIQSDSFLSVLAKELANSLTAAIVGLAFSNARDICLNTLSVLQKCIRLKESENDNVVALTYRKVSLTVINEMCVRYEGEKTKRKVAHIEAYENFSHADMAFEKEAANSRQIEALLLGDSLLGKSINSNMSETKAIFDQDESEDFILFPDDRPLHEKQNSVLSSRGSSMLGWNNYRGFGQALGRCISQSQNYDDTQNASDAAFRMLSNYLDAWNARQLVDDEESELVELFDVNSSAEHRYPGSTLNSLFNSVNAADIMTFFIELASTEKSRRNEIQSAILPSKRYNNTSFTQNVGWKVFMDIMLSKGYIEMNQVFERCMADGSRDYGGRLLTVPIHPQFPRVIPKQLDHSDLTINYTETDDENNLDLGRLNSLVQKGSLKIVDITKRGAVETVEVSDDTDSLDGYNVLVSKLSMDSESTVLEDHVVKDETILDFSPEQGQESQNEILQDSNQDYDDHTLRKEDISMELQSGNNIDANESGHEFTMSVFSYPPNTSSSSLQGDYQRTSANAHIHGSSSTGNIHYEHCMHIKAEGNRKGTLFITSNFLVFEYDDPSGLYEGEELLINQLKNKLDHDDNHERVLNDIDYESMIQQFRKIAAQRPRSIRWNISEISHIYLRRYRLRDSSLEIFFIPSGGDATGGPGLLSSMNSVLLDFGPGNEGNHLRDDAANAIMTRAPSSTVKQWPDKSAQFLHEHLRNITIGWVRGRVSNFEYLLALNCLAGRSFNDLCQYPVFPWVLSNYKSHEIPNLEDRSNYRDLTKPMGALNPDRLKEFMERFRTFDDPVIPPFMYGSHYSTSAGVVLHFLVRLHPFASLHRQLQGGHFDVADRLFSSVPKTWDMCTGQSAAEVKELTPEWYCNPSFLRNTNNFKLGVSQDGDKLGDVELPPWAQGSPEKFVEVLRCALESEICTSMLPDWIDLIFGRKQQGPEAVEANNVFFYLTYYGSCDVASIEDEDLRIATELQIAHFGQCPMQLFWRPHVHKLSRTNPRRILSFSDMLGVFDLETANPYTNVSRQLPFESAPISHWVHLFAPPPGPHAPLISLRLVFPDRCIAVDAQGIYHFFRWAWKPESEERSERPTKKIDLFSDKGYFVAQRELPHFRSVPRLIFSRQKPSSWKCRDDLAVVALSKCLFAGKSLLAVSDGDGKGGLCFQFIDPSKCNIQGDVFVRSVHSSRITAIHMDPFGAAAGVGGIGGELAIVASADGTASLWRFVSNRLHHLPLRPRQRFGGHRGQKIRAAAVNSNLNLCATVSAFRCCIFNITSGAMIQSISPPKNGIADDLGPSDGNMTSETRFIDSNAICIASSGFLVLVCETKLKLTDSSFERKIITLQLFTLEGIHIGSKALESWRGIPQKISSTYDGRAVMVCSGRGISFHLVSPIKPLHFIDEWKIGGDEEDLVFAHDIDFGPSPSRPIVAAAGLSSGALRIHALKGISAWSEENKKGTVTEAVGSVIGTVKGTGNKVVGLVKGTGSRVLGLGKEIGREALGDIASRGVTGFLGGLGLGKTNPTNPEV